MMPRSIRPSRSLSSGSLAEGRRFSGRCDYTSPELEYVEGLKNMLQSEVLLIRAFVLIAMKKISIAIGGFFAAASFTVSL